ncbi:MAG: hypothetical protein AAF871_05735 [Pseudomonadota bacterium]
MDDTGGEVQGHENGRDEMPSSDTPACGTERQTVPWPKMVGTPPPNTSTDPIGSEVAMPDAAPMLPPQSDLTAPTESLSSSVVEDSSAEDSLSFQLPTAIDQGDFDPPQAEGATPSPPDPIGDLYGAPPLDAEEIASSPSAEESLPFFVARKGANGSVELEADAEEPHAGSDLCVPPTDHPGFDGGDGAGSETGELTPSDAELPPLGELDEPEGAAPADKKALSPAPKAAEPHDQTIDRPEDVPEPGTFAEHSLPPASDNVVSEAGAGAEGFPEDLSDDAPETGDIAFQENMELEADTASEFGVELDGDTKASDAPFPVEPDLVSVSAEKLELDQGLPEFSSGAEPEVVSDAPVATTEPAAAPAGEEMNPEAAAPVQGSAAGAAELETAIGQDLLTKEAAPEPEGQLSTGAGADSAQSEEATGALLDAEPAEDMSSNEGPSTLPTAAPTTADTPAILGAEQRTGLEVSRPSIPEAIDHEWSMLEAWLGARLSSEQTLGSGAGILLSGDGAAIWKLFREAASVFGAALIPVPVYRVARQSLSDAATTLEAFFAAAECAGPAILYVPEVEHICPGEPSDRLAALGEKVIDLIDRVAPGGEIALILGSARPERLDPRLRLSTRCPTHIVLASGDVPARGEGEAQGAVSRFEDLVVTGEAKERLTDAVLRPLRHPAADRLGLALPGVVAISGSKGAGRGDLAAALAGAARFVPIWSDPMAGIEFDVFSSALGALCHQAEAAGPALLILDARGAALPSEFWTGATSILSNNLPSGCMAAILCDGADDLSHSADLTVTLTMPDRAERETFLRRSLAARPTQGEIDLASAVNASDGWTRDTMAKALNRAGQIALRRAENSDDPVPSITSEDIAAAFGA